MEMVHARTILRPTTWGEDAVAPLPGEKALYTVIRQVLEAAETDPEIKKSPGRGCCRDRGASD